jgi:energy-coupling factor transporter transmembrane protein EcfT
VTGSLGILGHVSCLAFSLAAAVLSRGEMLVAVAAVIVTLSWVFQRSGLGVLAHGQTWLLVALIGAPAVFFGGPPEAVLLGVPVSPVGARLGGEMALRATCVIIAASGFAAMASASELSGLLERAGLRGLGFALGVAVNMMPTVAATAGQTTQAMRLRGGFRRRRLASVRLLLSAILTGSLRHAGDIVSAAEARGYSVERPRPLPSLWRPLDVVVSVLLAVLLLALFVLSRR